MGGRKIRRRKSWRLARRCEALRQPCSLRPRRTSDVEARRRTCDCCETSSMEKQQLGCSVVAGWLRVCLCAATSRRGRSGGRAWVMRCSRASERLRVGARRVWHKGTGNSVALRNSGLWNMQRMQVKMSGLLGVQTPREWTGTAGLAAGGVSECCARRIKAGLLVCAGVSSCGGEAGSGARGCVKRRQRNASRVVSSCCVRQQHLQLDVQ